MVTIVKDGVRYSSPGELFLPKEEKTEIFYHIVESFQPEKREREGLPKKKENTLLFVMG